MLQYYGWAESNSQINRTCNFLHVCKLYNYQFKDQSENIYKTKSTHYNNEHYINLHVVGGVKPAKFSTVHVPVNDFKVLKILKPSN